jgi:protoheme IX farnesyltransferase
LLIFGIALCAGASSVFNAYIERETDARMTRTRNRPLPTGLIRPRSALLFAWLLTIAGLAILWFAGHWLGALVGALTIAFYVFVYTIWLKPKTPLNIVIGGAAGAAPPLIVDASLNGSIGWLSVALFGLVFLWTPPHFWAIALFRKQDYEMAGFPMLPLTHGDDATRRQILGYSLLMIPFALLPAAGSQLGMVYGVIAAAASVWFCLVCWRLLKTATNRCARQTMLASLVYLHVVFTAMTICLIA